jgi:hypothetical protein
MPADEVKRINPFDWSKEFEPVMVAGGFDAVIGNPPYVRQEGLKEQKEYLKNHYQVYQSLADLYTYFIEKGLSLLRPKGVFSYIVANKWMRANYGRSLRNFLKTIQINEIIDFGDLPIFKGTTTYPCIIRMTKSNFKDSINVTLVDALDFTNLEDYISHFKRNVDLAELTDDGWSLVDKKQHVLVERLIKENVSLDDYTNEQVFRGILTGLNKAFIINNDIRNRLISDDPKSADLIKPFLSGKDVKRYQILKSDKFLIYIPWHFPLNDDPTIVGASTKAEQEFKRQYPAIYHHLSQFKSELSNRNASETGIRYEWYALQRYGSEYFHEFEKPKIVYPEVCKQPEFTFDDSKLITNKTCFIIPCDNKYLLGILNSHLNYFFFQTILPKLRGGYFLPSYVSLKKIPIRTINFSDPVDKARHDRMVALVTQILDLNKKLREARLEQERTMLSRQIEATDASIDKLVYELYGLTEEEIRIVDHQ